MKKTIEIAPKLFGNLSIWLRSNIVCLKISIKKMDIISLSIFSFYLVIGPFIKRVKKMRKNTEFYW